MLNKESDGVKGLREIVFFGYILWIGIFVSGIEFGGSDVVRGRVLSVFYCVIYSEVIGYSCCVDRIENKCLNSDNWRFW